MRDKVNVLKINRKRHCDVAFSFDERASLEEFQKLLILEQISHGVDYKRLSVYVSAHKI